jgi:predicted transposase YdaD
MSLRERIRSKEEGRIEGKAEGKAESVILFLAEKAPVSKELSSHIMKETNIQTLDHWLKLAVSADSIEQFMENIHFTL